MPGPVVDPPLRSSRRQDELVVELTRLFLEEGFLEFGVGELSARLRCSRSTLYLVAQSKEQIVLRVLRRFFRDAAERIEADVIAEPDPGLRLGVYLRGVARELRPASARFFRDLSAYSPGREIYAENTRLAARRVQRLVDAGVEAGAMRAVNAAFVGSVVATVMADIQSGDILEAAEVTDAAAYGALADLVMDGIRRSPGSAGGSLRRDGGAVRK